MKHAGSEPTPMQGNSPSVEPCQSRLGESLPLEEIAQRLWAIIDDIDTYSDMAKGDQKLYRSLVERRQRDRFKYGTTDGYTVTLHTTK